jgi:MFS superfamily sulfate permease-like transporter
VAAAVLTIPVSMGCILSLQPLGEPCVSYGVLAGLVSAIVVPITAVRLGADTVMMYAPRSVVAFLTGSIVLHSFVKRGAVDAADVHAALTSVFLVIFAAGLIQALLGRFRLGSLVQYIPSPEPLTLREHQPIAIKLLGNVGRELSRRLRRANGTIYQLES